MQRQFRIGGGVAPKTTRLRGQSIIEYVLIIAVIGLVIVFAGPGVAGAIRNQFNLVCNTLDSGTSGGPEGSGASGGGSAGTDSAIVQAAVAKDAKDWTLDDQKAVAEDIAAKGEASPAYAKAKAAMDAGTEFSMKLTNSDILKYRIIGINHDDLADGSGKAGLSLGDYSNKLRYMAQVIGLRRNRVIQRPSMYRKDRHGTNDRCHDAVLYACNCPVWHRDRVQYVLARA